MRAYLRDWCRHPCAGVYRLDLGGHLKPAKGGQPFGKHSIMPLAAHGWGLSPAKLGTAGLSDLASATGSDDLKL